MARCGRIQEFSVRQSGSAILATVMFRGGDDIGVHLSGNLYRYVSPSSMTRLARAINSLGMQVELDEYGVPTWTRKAVGDEA